ncbi:Region of a membrane-bound protein predicted to be embedded in the membrane [Methanobacterium congolense]|uniref:Region of a membrane-bound protein predicted to be embedded in the membrane n=1 Tax=Methanobacterium congolense TaxID=118062 RepID=A0A1D3L163_9EURY|nr:Region of a membrane-bound protein predicted to be embedded in the membrane [Methanobacterium congolense]
MEKALKYGIIIVIIFFLAIFLLGFFFGFMDSMNQVQ